MPRSRSDIANTSVRIFLHEMGIAYDKERNLEPYKKAKHFDTVQTDFGHECCYCGEAFTRANPAVEDHLVPINKTSLGLHAWGNVVPSCRECNSEKQGRDWRDFIVQRAGSDAAERHTTMSEFVQKHQYAPRADLRDVTEELYDEVGEIAMTLIHSKINRLKDRI